jgi:hypothetical protein
MSDQNLTHSLNNNSHILSALKGQSIHGRIDDEKSSVVPNKGLIYIYVLLLEDNYYFIHHAYNRSDEQVMQEFEIHYDFLKLHRPIRVLDVMLEKDELHLDSVVKEYMYDHGYAYVRGGSYTNPELTPAEELVIDKELNTIAREYPPSHASTYNYLLANYIDREWKSVAELENEYRELKMEFAKYEDEKKQLDGIEIYLTNNESAGGAKKHEKRLDLCIISEIEQLRDFCKIRGDDFRKVTKEWTDKYQTLLPKIQHIVIKYAELCDSPCNKYAKYVNIPPQFFMDPFFYVYEFSPLPKRTSEEIDAFFESILYFANWTICRIQEYTFNVHSYAYDIEWLYPRIFYVLEKHISTMKLHQ